MTECLTDFPRYIRQRDNEWQGADHPDGPWRSIPAPRQALPWPTDGPAVQSREPASVAPEATGPRPLSLVEEVQERYRSAADEYPDPDGLAAALRAVADQVISSVPPPCADFDEYAKGFVAAHVEHRRELLAIADELEGLNA